MSDKVHKVSAWAVFAWLTVITVAEVGVVYLALTKTVLAVLPVVPEAVAVPME